MFINTISLHVKRLVPQNSKSIVQVIDIILVYGDKLLNTRYKIERNYTGKDAKGEYREYSSGRLSVRGIKSRKIYKVDDDDTQVLTSLWELYYTKGEYPTQKPYKLLERIICLGTK